MLQTKVQTERQIHLKDENLCNEDKRLFLGDEEQFIPFCRDLSKSNIPTLKELDINILPHPTVEEDSSLHRKMKACLCCAYCYQSCPGFMFCLNCILFIFFYWLILPLCCCLAICAGKDVVETVENSLFLKKETFEEMDNLAEKVKANKIKLKIADTELNSTKISFLRSMIQRSGAKEFELNNGGLVDNQSKEGVNYYGKFQKLIVEVTRLPGLKYDIKWGQIHLKN